MTAVSVSLNIISISINNISIYHISANYIAHLIKSKPVLNASAIRKLLLPWCSHWPDCLDSERFLYTSVGFLTVFTWYSNIQQCIHAAIHCAAGRIRCRLRINCNQIKFPHIFRKDNFCKTPVKLKITLSFKTSSNFRKTFLLCLVVWIWTDVRFSVLLMMQSHTRYNLYKSLTHTLSIIPILEYCSRTHAGTGGSCKLHT